MCLCIYLRVFGYAREWMSILFHFRKGALDKSERPDRREGVAFIEMKNLKISQIKPDLSWVSTTMLSAARRSFTTPEWPKRIWYKNLNIHACSRVWDTIYKMYLSGSPVASCVWPAVKSDRPDQACAWSSSPVKKGLTDLVRQVPGSAALWSLTDLVRLVPGQAALWTGVWPTWRG